MENKKESPTEETENTAKVAEEIEEEEPIVISDEKENDQVAEYKDMLQRLQAEFDNYRKRNNESVRIARLDGVNDVITDLLPVVDSFERGLSSVSENERTGLEKIYKQFTNLLGKYDIVEIEALGKDFDPNVHHAIAQCEDADNANKVVEVFQKGYKRKDKVLRVALVKVAQ